MDEYRSLLAEWYSECPSLQAKQVYRRLVDRGLKMSYVTVSRATRTFRRKKVKIFSDMAFLPGEEAQVDWFHENHPLIGKICGFAMILSYSRYVFIRFFSRSSFEFFIEGHLKAFDSFEGYPQALRYDNLKSVVIKREPLTYNPSFLGFARHYGFEIHLCNPASGNEKGRVERLIRTVRESFLNTAKTVKTLDALNDGVTEWMQTKNDTIHRVTLKKPSDLKGLERLKSLPGIPWKNVCLLPPALPTKTGFMIFDTNKYSIPEYLIRQRLQLGVTVTRVEIMTLKSKVIATHPRSFERNQIFLNPVHRTFGKLSSQAKRERILAIIKNMGPLMPGFLDENQKAGEDPYHTAYVIFKMLPHISRETIYSAIREALRQKKPFCKTLEDMLMIYPNLERDPVHPKQTSLLQIDYQPRSLQEYDHETPS
jgi:hypothetical protein